MNKIRLSLRLLLLSFLLIVYTTNYSRADIIPYCGTGGSGGSTIPGGIDGDLQINNSGSFGGLHIGSGLEVVGGSLISLGGNMVYPSAGVARSTGSAWGTSYTVGIGPNNLVQLNSSGQLPDVDGSLLINLTNLVDSYFTMPLAVGQIAIDRTTGALVFNPGGSNLQQSFIFSGASCTHGTVLITDGNGNWTCGTVESGFPYPSAGVPLSTGTAWGTSYSVGVAASNLVQLDSSAKLPTSTLPPNLQIINSLSPSSTKPLVGSSSNAWTVSAISLPISLPEGAILYSPAANQINGMLPVSNAVLVTNAYGYPSLSADMPTATTLGGNYIYRAGGTDVPVTDGGTGMSSFPQYGIPYAATTTVLSFVPIGTPGQVLAVNSAGTGYAFSTAASSMVYPSVGIPYSTGSAWSSSISAVTNGILQFSSAGAPQAVTSIPTGTTIGSSYIYRAGGTDVAVTDGGTGRSSFTLYGIPWAPTTTSLSFVPIGTAGQALTVNSSATGYVFADVAGSMVYPSAGVPLSTGSAWGTSYTVGVAASNLVQLDSSAKLPTSTLPSNLQAINSLTPSSLRPLIGNSSGAWTVSAVALPISIPEGLVLYSPVTNQINGLTPVSNAVLVTSATGWPSLSTSIPAAVTVGGNYIYRAGGTDVAVSDGGTGLSSFTQYGIPYASTSTALSFVPIGTAGQVLTVNSAGTGYTFSSASSVLTMDTIAVGTTYGKPLLSDMTSGHTTKLYTPDGLSYLQLSAISLAPIKMILPSTTFTVAGVDIVNEWSKMNVFDGITGLLGETTLGSRNSTTGIRTNVFVDGIMFPHSYGRIAWKWGVDANFTSDTYSKYSTIITNEDTGPLFVKTTILPTPESGVHVRFVYTYGGPWYIQTGTSDTTNIHFFKGTAYTYVPGATKRLYCADGADLGSTLECVCTPFNGTLAWSCTSNSTRWTVINK